MKKKENALDSNERSETKGTNEYNAYSSKIKRLYIALPNHKFFHQPSNVESVDGRFVGRESISAKLKDWLKFSEENPTGSYLVTGYRGMGKSSFVGKTISEMVEEKRVPTLSWLGRKYKSFMKPFLDIVEKIIALIPSEIDSFFLFGKKLSRISKFVLSYVIILSLSIWTFRNFGNLSLEDSSPIVIFSVVYLISIITVLKISIVILKIDCPKKSKHIHHISLNLGGEISTERDVLALITDSIRAKITEFKSKYYPYTHQAFISRLISSMFIAFIAAFFYSLLHKFSDVTDIFLTHPNDAYLHVIIKYIGKLVRVLFNSSFGWVLNYLLVFLLAIMAYKLIITAVRFFAAKLGLNRYFVTPKEILRELDKLCDRIDSSVDEDNDPYGSINTTGIGLTLRKKRTKKYQVATIREIEQDLIRILEQINNSLLFRSNFIIVLDELDKVNVKARESLANHNKESDDNDDFPEFAFDNSGFPGSNSSHNKKQNVLYLLAKLKYFISNAKAKFVFISGRELYDAYLADVSDREFSISSIFNGVLNVDSFLSCDSQTKDATKMTEIYLCKQLRDKKAVEEDKKTNKKEQEIYSLSAYYKDLLDLKKKKKEEIERVVVFLAQYITNLTYLSNGAPKKIALQFEKRVISREEYERDCETGEHVTINENEKTEYYLSFGYYDQQRIGFIHYMASPILNTIISPSSEYGDKLLISASFLIGHIYKHHKGGFSWQDLGYIPELIDSSRNPELRDFINSMIGYLGQIHLTQITTGLYHYKFPMRLYEEISVFSKKSEQVSAVFNFSVDDSRSIQRYFAEMIKYHRKQEECSPIILCELHYYLGDLNLAAEKFTEAINHYRVANDIITKELDKDRNLEDKKSPALIVLLLRIMLKMGLANEKRNNMDTAYLNYSELIDRLIEYRYINEESLGMEFKLEKDNSWKGNRTFLYKKEITDWSREKDEHNKFHRKIYPDFITEENPSYWVYNDELIPNMAYNLTPEKSHLISRLSIYEDLRLAYLPILAKLFVIEKQNVCGITLSNIAVTEAEFKYLFLATSNKEKYILSVDFFRKLGDILFYKNSSFGESLTTISALFNAWGYNIKQDVFDFCYNKGLKKSETKMMMEVFEKMKYWTYFMEMLKWVINMNPSQENLKKILRLILFDCAKLYLKENEIKLEASEVKEFLDSPFFAIPDDIIYRLGTMYDCYKRRCGIEIEIEIEKVKPENKRILPCFACKYYNRSLSILATKLLPKQESDYSLSKSIRLLEAIQNGTLSTKREKNLTQVALSLEALANVMICCTTTDKITDKFISAVSAFLEQESSEGFSALKQIQMSQIEKAFMNYLTAAEYHIKASNTKEVAQCYQNIFELLATYLSVNSSDNKKIWGEFMDTLYNTILSKAIRYSYDNHNFNDLLEFKDLHQKVELNTKLGNSSIMPEIEDMIISYYEVCEKLSRKGIVINNFNDKILKKLYNSPSLNYLRLESLTYTRISSLLFKAKLNRLMLDRMFDLEGNSEIKTMSVIDFEKKFTGISTYLKQDSLYFLNHLPFSYPLFFRDPLFFSYPLFFLDHFPFSYPLFFSYRSPFSKIQDIISPLGANFTTLIEKEQVLSLVEFLITDSIFCLSEIAGFVAPTFRTTLFTNSYCAKTYEKLLEWVKLKEILEDFYKEKEIEPRGENFKKYFEAKIDANSRKILPKTYLSEMAIKYYTKAMEMHSEGQSYQDFIIGFNLLDDDLQNNTCQFYLALERYRINTGTNENQIKKIKENKKVTGKKCYQGLNYFDAARAFRS